MKVKYCIKNLNKDKLLKQILQTTKVVNLKIDEEKITFYINQNNQKTVDKILNNNSTKIIYKTDSILHKLLKKTVLNIGIIIPIFIFIIFQIILNNFVLSFNIQGINRISQNEILQILNELNIKIFTFKTAINTKQIEEEILKNSNASLVSVITKGNTLVINVKEKLNNEEYENVGIFGSLYSTVNGVVTEVSIIQGSSSIKVGDIIKAGQELVSPNIVDTSGNLRQVKPLADIKADIFYTIVLDVPDVKIEQVPTGKQVKSKRICLGGVEIFNEKKLPKFKNYTSSKKQLFLTENNIFAVTSWRSYILWDCVCWT